MSSPPQPPFPASPANSLASPGSLLAALILVIPCSAQTIEHLSNGSFENPTNFVGSSSTAGYDLPAYHRSGEWGNPVVNVPGWNMTALGTPDLVLAPTAGDADPTPYQGTDGDHFISASAYEDWQHEGLSTTFMVQDGVEYTFRFDHAQGGIYNELTKSWIDYEWMTEWTASLTGAHTQNFYALNNPLSFSSSASENPVVWQSFSDTFTPTASGLVTLQFTTDNTDDFDQTYLFLDNVSVTSTIPEAGWGWLGTGSAMLVLRRRRRARNE